MLDAILIVDDNWETRQALFRLLASEGYPVVSCRNGREALDYLRGGGKVSLIVLDLLMDEMSGPAFLATRAADPALERIPVIVYTGLRAEPLENVAAQVRKSGDPDALLSAIGGVLGPPSRGSALPS
jgi:CheY-like chemotaxis protein